jgi:endonuclease/exonuclease/phosphatase family metal-dependent hydrolase
MNYPAVMYATAGLLAIAVSGHPRHERFARNDPEYRVVFYNAENFFDTRNDSLTDDDEFTPEGARHWNYPKYKSKINNLYKTFIALGNWSPPALIGLCEVENRQVLTDLVNNSPLSKFNYSVIHSNSPDKRGIDVAILYDSERVKILKSRYFGITREGLFTRDILYCMARMGKDTCHFLINHWPSRSGGQLETEPLRLAAASCLREIADSLFISYSQPKIIIMGDFNDEPHDASLFLQLQAKTDTSNASSDYLYNLSFAPEKSKIKGTVKFRGEWTLFDQIIVSGSLLVSGKGMYVEPPGYHIFGESFLLVPDEQYNGLKPFRTYNGYIYQGGFSDHLAVYIDLGTRDQPGTRDEGQVRPFKWSQTLEGLDKWK